ncbi:dirigent protein 23-like [Amaranthus tricolor]|uniref:dirigent protein 23-like n=1 Tax=Amaranthus tricolor TaxID=29722 RepID=UPI00258B9F67|nr:dirigent protein 23-like [Amaranthus tricolor]
MSKFVLITFFIFVTFTSYMGFIRAQKPDTQTWAKTEDYGHEQKTVLQFYFHDNQTGDFTTVALIAQPIEPTSSVSSFGRLFMVDDPLTDGPDPNSKLVGRAQGFYGSASQTGVSYMMSLTYGFVDGIYNGSSVVMLGRNTIADSVRELPVVGGTGLFRMARGYALAQTYSHNSTARNAIVGYNVTIIHP